MTVCHFIIHAIMVKIMGMANIILYMTKPTMAPKASGIINRRLPTQGRSIVQSTSEVNKRFMHGPQSLPKGRNGYVTCDFVDPCLVLTSLGLFLNLDPHFIPMRRVLSGSREERCSVLLPQQLTSHRIAPFAFPSSNTIRPL